MGRKGRENGWGRGGQLHERGELGRVLRKEPSTGNSQLYGAGLWRVTSSENASIGCRVELWLGISV